MRAAKQCVEIWRSIPSVVSDDRKDPGVKIAWISKVRNKYVLKIVTPTKRLTFKFGAGKVHTSRKSCLDGG